MGISGSGQQDPWAPLPKGSWKKRTREKGGKRKKTGRIELFWAAATSLNYPPKKPSSKYWGGSSNGEGGWGKKKDRMGMQVQKTQDSSGRINYRKFWERNL